jgi:mannose-6-phosphate isomerase-like protein (cupin superfamily)
VQKRDGFVIRSADVEPFKLESGAQLRMVNGDECGFGDVSLIVSEYPAGAGADVTHRHPHISSIVVTEGRGLFTVGDQTVAAEAGDIVVVPADTWHSFRNDGEGPLRVVGVHDSGQHATELPE